MFDRITSLLTVALMAAVFVLFEMGQISPRDAFFVASAIVIVFTGQQFIAREDMGLVEAAKSIVARPQSYRSHTSLAAYLTCIAVGLFVTAQIVATA